MKRWLCLPLALCLGLAAGCGQTPAASAVPESQTAAASPLPEHQPQQDAVLVAEPLQAGDGQRQPGEFMALESYGSGLEVEGEKRLDAALVRGFEGGGESFAALQAYVELLCSEYDFVLAAEPYAETIESTFFDFCLLYTGPQAPAAHTQEGTYSGMPCDLTIYGTVERGRLEGALWYDPALTGLDGGYRWGKEPADTAPAGRSALAGLLRGADGVFSTTDGRLAVQSGQAVLLWDETAQPASARFVLNEDKERQEVLLEQDGAALARFYLPLSCQLTTGRMFGQEQFVVESGFAAEAGGLFDSMPQYTWPSLFAVRREEGWLVPVLGMGGGMKRLTVRVMYADGETAVFYACASFDAAPYELELLAAVALTGEGTRPTPTPAGTAAGERPCSSCGGSGDCSGCGGSGRVRKALAGTGEWVEQACTACRPAGSGNCPFCGG